MDFQLSGLLRSAHRLCSKSPNGVSAQRYDRVSVPAPLGLTVFVGFAFTSLVAAKLNGLL